LALVSIIFDEVGVEFSQQNPNRQGNFTHSRGLKQPPLHCVSADDPAAALERSGILQRRSK
jgi:hypothetical protein